MLGIQQELHKCQLCSRSSMNARYTVRALYMLGIQQKLHKCVLANFSVRQEPTGERSSRPGGPRLTHLPPPSCVALGGQQSHWTSDLLSVTRMPGASESQGQGEGYTRQLHMSQDRSSSLQYTSCSLFQIFCYFSFKQMIATTMKRLERLMFNNSFLSDLSVRKKNLRIFSENFLKDKNFTG